MSWMLASSDEYKAVTPNDTVLLTYPNDQGDEITRKCKGILVAVAGTIITNNSAGNPITQTVAAGIIHPISTNLIKTGGSASGIVAYF